MNVVFFFAAFAIKHFICDFVLQRSYQYLNKGIYGHPGGLLHAALHGIGTFVVLLPLGMLPALSGAAFDSIVHYHLDWGRARVNDHYKFTTTQDAFWVLLGLDQLLHALTYVVIVALWVM